jgi:hypothetical protein
LTTLESLYLGVPCRTRSGRLFSQRHSLAHCRYAGQPDSELLIEGFVPVRRERVARLLGDDSPRLDHAALADEMLSVFRGNP